MVPAMLVGVARSGRRGWSHALAAIFTVAAWTTQVLIGEDLPAVAYIALLVCGGFSALLAYLLPVNYARLERAERLAARDLATKAVADYKLQVHDMLIPLSTLVTDILVETGQGRRNGQHTLRQLVVDLAAQNIGPERTRACFFEFSDGPPRMLTRPNWHGRNQNPRPCFQENTPEGNYVFSTVDRRGWILVKDVDTAQLPGWTGKAEYKTFICVTVCSEKHIYGMLTLDSLQAGDLNDDDLLLMRLLAQLLATGLSAQ
jgi:hypothetical protein